jgi:mannose-6-phosphate isomerase
MSDFYPLVMQPHLVSKVWGGRRLEKLFGKPLPGEETYGEAWEVADLEEGQSVVANGPLEGHTLRQVVERWGHELIGERAPGDRFPLLVKLLDARADLSVQVHPGPEDVDLHFPEASSKDECWLILDADAEGSILHGFAEGVDRASFERAVAEDRAVEALRRVRVEAGDIVRVAPGTVHAICGGVSLLEIQEPSDTTFRVYDYDRPGLDGKPRELHLSEAMQVARFGDIGPATLAATQYSDIFPGHHECLVDADSYRIERLRGVSEAVWRVTPDAPQVLFVERGEWSIRSESTEVRLSPYTTVVLPASLGRVEVESDRPGGRLVVAGLGGQALVTL